MAEYNEQLKVQVIEALTPIFRAYQGVLSLGEIRDGSIESIREYFYFGMETKLCTKCKIMKEKKYFGVDVSKPDGLFHWCRECRARGYKERKNEGV